MKWSDLTQLKKSGGTGGPENSRSQIATQVAHGGHAHPTGPQILSVPPSRTASSNSPRSNTTPPQKENREESLKLSQRRAAGSDLCLTPRRGEGGGGRGWRPRRCPAGLRSLRTASRTTARWEVLPRSYSFVGCSLILGLSWVPVW
jgi:hypothetical protein